MNSGSLGLSLNFCFELAAAAGDCGFLHVSPEHHKKQLLLSLEVLRGLTADRLSWKLERKLSLLQNGCHQLTLGL